LPSSRRDVAGVFSGAQEGAANCGSKGTGNNVTCQRFAQLSFAVV